MIIVVIFRILSFAFLCEADIVENLVTEDREVLMPCPPYDRATTGIQQRSMQAIEFNHTRRRSKRSCLVVVFDVLYEDNHQVDQPLACELQGEDLNGKLYKMVRIKGLTSSWAKKHNVTSGKSTIFIPEGADIADETSQLIIRAGATIKLGRYEGNSFGATTKSLANMIDPVNMIWHRKLAAVVRTVLVIRIVAKDSAIPETEKKLADKIFGFDGDTFNLKSSIEKCSYGDMLIKPLSTNRIIGTNAVYTANLPNTVVGKMFGSEVVAAAITKITTDLGMHPSTLANHVMFCVPAGTKDTWVAYASFNHWQSAYSGNWCTVAGTQLHEIGHNLNLDHSGVMRSTGIIGEYEDKSGLMGYAFPDKNTDSRRCFNAANAWQLGWYGAHRVNLPISHSFIWSGSLVGFAERDATSSTDRLILRIRHTLDYYIHFNNKAGINAGTNTGANQVLVTSRAPGTGPAQSAVVAILSQAGFYSFPIWNAKGVALTVFVHTIDFTTIPARAIVSTQFGIPTLPPTSVPTVARTRVPTLSPTRVPTRVPTLSPTRVPTRVPTLSPTRVPTRVPTMAPTSAPTSAPTRAPSKSPTSTPTASPTKSPTSVPSSYAPSAIPSYTSAPTLTALPSTATKMPLTLAPLAPTSVPSVAPTRKTTTKAPTRKPTTKAPTRKPTTKTPTRNRATKTPTRKSTTKTPTRKRATMSPTRTPTKKRRSGSAQW